MKKLLLVAIMAAAGIAAAVAQPRAIGANIGYGLDVSYQHSLGTDNMIDLSVNIPLFNGIGATATYDWINPFGLQIPWNNKGEWNWNLGVGAVGHVGVEYNFWFPLQLSIDWRPNIGIATGGGFAAGGDTGVGMPARRAQAVNTGGLVFNTAGLYSGITIGVRYLF